MRLNWLISFFVKISKLHPHFSYLWICNSPCDNFLFFFLTITFFIFYFEAESKKLPYSLLFQKTIAYEYENKNVGYLKQLFMQMSRCRRWRICHAIRDARTEQSMYTLTCIQLLPHSDSLPDSHKHWSPELQRKWLEFKQTCQPELVLSSVPSGSSVSPLFSALIISVPFQYADFIISQPDLHEKLLYSSWLLVSWYYWDHQHNCIPVGMERLCCVFY